MSELQTLISYTRIWLGAVTAEQWFTFGSIIGSALVTIGVIAWIKRHHLKKTAEKLAGQFVTLNLNFWGFIGAVAAFIITNGPQWGALLPFMATHGPQITVAATTLYAVSKLLKQWFSDRKAGKPLLGTITADTDVDGIVDTPPVVPAPVAAVTQDIWGAK